MQQSSFTYNILQAFLFKNLKFITAQFLEKGEKLFSYQTLQKLSELQTKTMEPSHTTLDTHKHTRFSSPEKLSELLVQQVGK